MGGISVLPRHHVTHGAHIKHMQTKNLKCFSICKMLFDCCKWSDAINIADCNHLIHFEYILTNVMSLYHFFINILHKVIFSIKSFITDW
jgi:hypothetical protein